MKRMTIAGLSAAALAAGLGLGTQSLANADSGDTNDTPPAATASPSEDSSADTKPGRVGRKLLDTESLAEKLGVTVEKLESAIDDLPRLNREKGAASDSETSRAERRQALATHLAEALELDEAKVTSALDELQAERTAARQAKTKEALQAAVTDGTLSSTEATAVQKAIDEGLVELSRTQR